jgi:hypothetical protein
VWARTVWAVMILLIGIVPCGAKPERPFLILLGGIGVQIVTIGALVNDPEGFICKASDHIEYHKSILNEFAEVRRPKCYTGLVVPGSAGISDYRTFLRFGRLACVVDPRVQILPINCIGRREHSPCRIKCNIECGLPPDVVVVDNDFDGLSYLHGAIWKGHNRRNPRPVSSNQAFLGRVNGLVGLRTRLLQLPPLKTRNASAYDGRADECPRPPDKSGRPVSQVWVSYVYGIASAACLWLGWLCLGKFIRYTPGADNCVGWRTGLFWFVIAAFLIYHGVSFLSHDNLRPIFQP